AFFFFFQAEDGIRDPHAVRDPDGRAAPARGRGPQGEVPDQLRQRLVPLVHASARRAAGQHLVRDEEHAPGLTGRGKPNPRIFVRSPLDATGAPMSADQLSRRAFLAAAGAAGAAWLAVDAETLHAALVHARRTVALPPPY